jgi:aspartate racemase
MNERPLAIGVLGGMGPEATVGLFDKIVQADRVPRDQDHLRVVVECDPSIPDRTAHLLRGGENPLPAMIRSGMRLAGAGAGVGGVACMTAHAFIEALRAALPFRMLSAFEELGREIAAHYPAQTRVGVLATTGSRRAGLYERGLPGLSILWPSEEEQEALVMEAIYGRAGIKAGSPVEGPRLLLVGAAASLVASGAELVVAGCTEVPLALRPVDVAVPLLDPMEILARALVAAARGA